MPPTLASDQPFSHVARQMNKLVDQLSKGYYNFCPSDETWTPNVNLYELESSYVVCVDLAGVEKEKIELTVHEHRLKLKGTRVVPLPPTISESDPAAKRTRVHLMEIDHGSFCREVELPRDIDQERIAAQYLNGLLWIELPKK